MYHYIAINIFGRSSRINFKNYVCFLLLKLIFSANVLQRNALNANVEFRNGFRKPVAVLHLAAFFNSLDVFKFLIECGMNLRQPSAELYYPLHYAGLNNSLDIVRYILEKDPHEINESNQAPRCFICCAIRFNSTDVLQLLLEKGAKHCREADPLSMAMCLNQMDTFKMVYEASMRHHTDYSLLMKSIILRNESCVQYLLESGEDPNYIAKDYQTALSLACFTNQENIVKLLCNHIDIVDIDPNLKQKAAVHWICESKNPEIVRMVLAKGIDVNRRDQSGHSGPFYLCDAPNEDCTIDILEQLLHAGLDVNGEGVPILYEFVESLK